MSFNFGPTQASNPPAFGSSTTGFCFGAPTSAPATAFGNTATSTAFGFGGAQPTATSTGSAFGFSGAPTAFGPTPTLQPALNFGTSTSTIGFGAPVSSSGGFGGLASAPTSSVFGAPQTSSTFGAPQTSTTFGAPQTSTTFGAPQTSTTFGAPLTSTTFGAPQTSTTFGAPQTSTTFGAPQTSSVFGAPQTSTTFGAPQTSTTFGAPQTSTTFGAPQTSTTFGAPQTSTTFGAPISAGGFGGLGGQPVQGFQSVLPISSASTGLGGTLVPLLGAGIAQPVPDVKNDFKAMKEMSIPSEVFQTVEDLKKYAKEEKSISSDIIHMSSKTHDKISSQTEGLRRLMILLGSELCKQKLQLEKIKKENSEGLLNAEIAQRTRDAPPGLQFENQAPQEYFMRLVGNFEHLMVTFRRQIDETEAHLHSMTTHSGVTPDHLLDAIRKQHKAFISLTGRYHQVHEALKQEKETFSNLYRQSHGTNGTFFVERKPLVERSKNLPTSVGPSPFSGQKDDFALARSAMSYRIQNQTLIGAGPPTLGLGVGTNKGSSNFVTSFVGQTNLAQNGQTSLLQGGQNTSAFGNTSTPGMFGSTMSPFSNNNQPTSIFQTGGKRGKH